MAVSAPSALGTWTVTFTDSTHGTLTGPGITATNFDLPADAVANNFSPATSFLQFGMFKNDGANDGHNNGAHGTFSRVQFTGAPANSFDDSFTGATLTNKYAWRKTDANYVQYVAPGTAWIVDWTLPAIGFTPQSRLGDHRALDSSRFHLDVSRSDHNAWLGFPIRVLQCRLLPPDQASLRQAAGVDARRNGGPYTTTGKTGTPDPQTSWYVVQRYG